MNRRAFLTLMLLTPAGAWCWGDEGHELVARIAAAHLSPQARSAVALLLHQDADLASLTRLDEAMARAAIWPDHMPGGKGPTAPWHYVDIGLYEGAMHLPERCPEGNCIVAKMIQYLLHLKDHRPDGKWSEYRELEFLLHFAGDIHQPLHCVSNADAGGNCVNVTGFDPMHNLHAVWDITLVRNLMARDGPDLMAGMEKRFQNNLQQWQDYGSIEKITGESFNLAKSQVYGKARPRIPVVPTFVDVQPRTCATEAPESIRTVQVDGPRSYGPASLDVVRAQLYRAGVRLAAMLNQVYGNSQ